MWSISEIDASDPHVEEARSALRVLALCHDLTKRTERTGERTNGISEAAARRDSQPIILQG